MIKQSLVIIAYSFSDWKLKISFVRDLFKDGVDDPTEKKQQMAYTLRITAATVLAHTTTANTAAAAVVRGIEAQKVRTVMEVAND